MRLDGYWARQSLVGLSAHCANSYIPHVQHIIQYICAAGPLPLFQVFLENPFLIMAFCTILCQSYILLPFLNGFYTPLYISLSHSVSELDQTEEECQAQEVEIWEKRPRIADLDPVDGQQSKRKCTALQPMSN